MNCNPRVLVYVAVMPYGYVIACRHCGETYGFSSDRDMRYLAGLNRNRRQSVVRKRGKWGRRVTGGGAVVALLVVCGLAKSAQPPTDTKLSPQAVTVQVPQPLAVEMTQPPQPVVVKVISAPVDTTAQRLVIATWVLVVANAALCLVTFFGARKQSQDMRDSIAVARQAADAAGRAADAANQSAQLSARERREALERETNLAAHRVTQTASIVKELAVGLLPTYQESFGAAGRQGVDPRTEPVRIQAEKRVEFAKEQSDAAQGLLDAEFARKSEDELVRELRRLDASLVRLEAIKEEIAVERATVEGKIRKNREALLAAGGRLAPTL